MDENLVQLIQQVIDIVKDTAPDLWRIALMQVKAFEIQQIVAIIITAGVFVFGLSHLKRATKEKKQYREERIYHGGYWEDDVYLFVAVPCLACGIYTLVGIVSIIPYFFNPEYYAILKLLEMVK